MKTGIPWKTKTNRTRDFLNIGVQSFRHAYLHETILRYVQKDPDDIRWKICKNEFDELVVTKKRNPLKGPMGFRVESTGVLEGWVLNSYAKSTYT